MRKVTSFWLDPVICEKFRDACDISGRKTCDVIEPLMKAYSRMIKKSLVESNPCPFDAIRIEIKTLKLESLYQKRGASKGEVRCWVTKKYGSMGYCLHVCKHGGGYLQGGEGDLCPKYREMSSIA